MEQSTTTTDLPLLVRTPDEWASVALSDTLALLNDHAYLEKKAASNALELLNRWPSPSCLEEWTSILSAIASDEASHLNGVVRLMTERGGQLERTHRNDYANRLRLQVRQGQGEKELLDRLLVSALIELRSCERFELLAKHCQTHDPGLGRFYQRLWSSELGHYRVFLELSRWVVDRAEMEERWKEMLAIEADAITAQPPGPRIHSGCPPTMPLPQSC